MMQLARNLKKKKKIREREVVEVIALMAGSEQSRFPCPPVPHSVVVVDQPDIYSTIIILLVIFFSNYKYLEARSKVIRRVCHRILFSF